MRGRQSFATPDKLPGRGASLRDVLKVGVALSGLCLAVPAQAQIDEIVVTAQKRETLLQKTSISISALTGDSIEKRRLFGISDIAQNVLGLTFVQAAGANTFVSIRGAFKTDDSAGIDQTTAIFVDEIYNASMIDFDPEIFDVERVEVLRGPQGTLFGRNSLGGAVSIITRQPEFEPDAMVQISVGEDSLREVRGYVTGPVSSTVAGRLSFMSTNVDGYVNNIVDGDSIGARDKTALRGKLLIGPLNGAELTLGADYMWEDSDAVVYSQDVRGGTPSLFPAGTTVFGGPDAVAQGSGAGFIRRELWGGYADLSVDFNDVTFKSVTGFRYTDYDSFQESDGSPIPTVDVGTTALYKQFSQEFRISSSIGERFDWIAGVYGLYQDRRRESEITFNILPGQVLSLFGLPTGITVSNQAQEIETTSLAGFGTITTYINDKLSLELGARYTWDRKEGTTFKFGSPNPITHTETYTVSYSDEWSAFTGRAALNFDPTDDARLFATVSRGFTSGGFPLFGLTAAEATVPLDPEFALSYEVGAKTRWLDDRLQVNASIFQVNYTDLQVESLTSALVFQQDNAGKARVRGFDLEVVAQPHQYLTLNGGYGYMDAVYTDFRNCTDNGDDCTGNTFPGTPEHIVNIGFNLSAPINESLNISLDANYSYKSAVFLTATNERPDFIRNQTKYDGIVDARLALGTAEGRWELALWGKNLTDEQSITSSVEVSSLVGTLGEVLGGLEYYRSVYTRPRSAGVSLRWQWR